MMVVQLSQLILAFVIQGTIYLSVTVLFAWLFQLVVAQVSFGMGPALFKYGKLSIAPIFTGSYVKFTKSSSQEFESESGKRAIDQANRFVTALLMVGGHLACLTLAILMAGRDGWARISESCHVSNVDRVAGALRESGSPRTWASEVNSTIPWGRFASITISPFPAAYQLTEDHFHSFAGRSLLDPAQMALISAPICVICG